MKREFLTVYDYGMGGIWMVFRARSANEIVQKYPMLIPFGERPAWMTAEVHVRIRANRFYDIDEEPTGWLRNLAEE